jgi:3-dehydroquinate synthase
MQQTDAELVQIAKPYGKVFIIIDPVVKIEIPRLYAEKEVHYFPIISPESKKNLDTCTLIWKELTRLNFERKDLVVNIGGGAILDIGGFVASTYKRGIDFVNVPTTLLAMADASIGGKTGINFEGIKNMIGTFQWSIATIRDYKFLETLSEEEMRNGMAEIIKHAIIADIRLFEDIVQTLNIIIEEKWFSSYWIGWSFIIKMGIVNSDPHEEGRRKLLNFGHTIGHALEAHYKIPHGRAVAAGMIMESLISLSKGILQREGFDFIKELIHKIGIGKERINETDIPALINLMKADKKNENSLFKFVLPERIGSARYDVDVNEEEIAFALNYYIRT